MEQDYRYDLFVSCAAADFEWVQGFLLPALGLSEERVISNQPLVSGASSFRPGAPIPEEFQRAVKDSRFTVLILSPAYIADGWAMYSAQMITYLTVEERRDRLIPLEREKSKLPLDIEFRVRLDCTERKYWEASAAKLRGLLDQPEPAPECIPCPYPGMKAFGETDNERFFGRDREVKELLERLRLERFMVVIGPSGCGKSSLVFAGLVPALIKSKLFGSGEWLISSLRPGERPLAVLADTLQGDPAKADQTVRNLLSSKPNAKRLLLVIDQFEELFTVAQQDKNSFQDLLLSLAQTDHCYVVLTVRSDFYSYLMASPIWPQVQAHRLVVPPLDEEGLRRAIVQPATDVKVFVEGELVERLVRELSGQPGALPFLQETLLLLWERLQRRFLPLSAYGEMGEPERTGIQVAMARRGDAALSKLSSEQQAIARRIFLRLVQFGEGRADTRRQQMVAELASVSNDTSFERTLEKLAKEQNRLLTLSGEEKGFGIKVDFAHEALITCWPKLHGLITQYRDAEKARRRLDAKVQDWKEYRRQGKDEGGLLDAVELKEAEQWLNSPDAADLGPGDLPPLVLASREAIERAEMEQEAARQRELEQAQALAEERRIRLIETQRLRYLTAAQALAAHANYELHQNPQRSLLLAVEGIRMMSRAHNSLVPAALQSLRNAVSTTGGSPVRGHEGTVYSVAFSSSGRWLASAGSDRKIRLLSVSEPNSAPTILAGHEHVVSSVAFSPNERLLASGSGDRTVRLWDMADPKAEPIILPGHEGPVFSIAFSPNSRLLASGCRDKTIRLWDMTKLKTDPVILRGHKGSVTSVAFSPKGRLLASGSEDRTIRLWDTITPKVKPVVLSGHESAVTSVAFSPNGQLLASACQDQAVRLWHTADLKAEPIVLRGHEGPVFSVAFHPNGQVLASGSGDQAIYLWDTADPRKEPVVLRGHESTVRSVAFSPSGQSLASAGGDETVRLWDATNPLPDPVILRGHQSFVRSVAFSPDGRFLTSGSGDQTVRMWDTTNPKAMPAILRGHRDTVRSVAFSPSGQFLASGSRDKTIRLWDMTKLKAEPIILRGHEGHVSSTAFSPDGRFLASGNWDRMIYLRDTSNLKAPPVILHGHDDSVYSVAFSPNGRALASGSRDQSVCLWDFAALKPNMAVLGLHESGVFCLSFSSDGRMLASGGEDRTVRLWNTTSPKTEPIILQGHEGPVFSVAFSPNGRLLASGSEDKTVRLWDTMNPKATPVILRGHEDSVLSVAFSPNDRLLASGSRDQTVRLWNISTNKLVAIACTTAGRNLTDDEWRQYFGDEPYNPTCDDLPVAEEFE